MQMAEDRVFLDVDAIGEIYRAQNSELERGFWNAIQAGELEAVKVVFTPELAAARGLFGWQAIHTAVAYEQLDVVRYLCEKGVDINARDTSRPPMTPLMLARWGLH